MESAKGIIWELLKGTPFEKAGVTPQLTQRELKIEMNEEQFKKTLVAGLEPEKAVKLLTCMDIKFLNGKMIVTIKLL